MRLITLLLGMALEVSAASSYKLLSECDQSSEVRALIAKDAQITVHYAIASATTCYSVTAMIDGKPVRGYVLDAELDGVLAFKKATIKARQEMVDVPAVLPAAAPSEPTPDPAANATDPKKSVDAPEPVKETPKAKPDQQPQ